ncbi:MAG: hypothetical protein Q8P50_14970 [Bacillota bacterium]|nr:hypothetical protein [Bacillota bacterium]
MHHDEDNAEDGDSQAGSLGGEAPFGPPSLEDDVEHGDDTERRRAREEATDLHVAVTIERCPLLVYESLAQLRGKHERLRSLSAVTVYTSRTGVLVIQRVPAIRELETIRKAAYHQADESVLALFSNLTLNPPSLVGSHDRRLTARTFRWVDGAVVDIATSLGLPRNTILTFTLAAGLDQSVRWVPPSYRLTFTQCVNDFAAYIAKRVELASRLVR